MRKGRATRSSDTGAAQVPRVLRGAAVAVVGLGQIGGSIVRRLARHRPAIALLGHDHRAEIAGPAGRFCTWCDNLDDLVRRSDIVVLAVPVPVSIRLLSRIARAAERRAEGRRRLLVCDVGTVKAPVVNAAARFAESFDFVGLHPLAGGERNGWASGDAGLFDGCAFVYCPAAPSLDARARAVIRALGGRPVAIDAASHDRTVAETIGLPHLLAFAVAGLSGASGPGNKLRGRSWASLTRVAASDPAMVAGFFHGNTVNQRKVLAQLRRRLDVIDRSLRQASDRRIEGLLARWQPGARPAGKG